VVSHSTIAAEQRACRPRSVGTSALRRGCLSWDQLTTRARKRLQAAEVPDKEESDTANDTERCVLVYR
jgi:hypothetical protein